MQPVCSKKKAISTQMQKLIAEDIFIDDRFCKGLVASKESCHHTETDLSSNFVLTSLLMIMLSFL
jgi:hypothetical protein